MTWHPIHLNFLISASVYIEIGKKYYEEGGYCRGKKKEWQSRESRVYGVGKEQCKDTMQII
jgi:hypothetical protein